MCLPAYNGLSANKIYVRVMRIGFTSSFYSTVAHRMVLGVVLLTLLGAQVAHGQKWKKRPWDATMSLGTTNFFGDLGGGQGDAAHFMGVKDLDFAASRPVLQLGLRYKFAERFSARGNLGIGMIGANDKYSGHIGREMRNLHFRSLLVETSGQIEFYFIKEEMAARYRYSSVAGLASISGYLFLGVGGVYFNPQAEYEGRWYSLQPLGTEGQGIGDNPAKYSRIAAVFPGGVGLKYTLDRFWTVGMEMGIRYTLSDYVDDTSGSYYNVDIIREAYGDVAAALADRNRDIYFSPDGNFVPYITNDRPDGYAPPRGSPKFNDAYMFMMVTASYRFRYGLFGGMFRMGNRAKY